MMKALSLIIGVVLAATLAAQNHDNNMEKRAAGDVVFNTTVRVGASMVPPGEYRVVCDRTKIMFTRKLDKKQFEFVCKGKVLEKVSPETRMLTDLDKNGVRYLNKLTLAGGNVEHVFD